MKNRIFTDKEYMAQGFKAEELPIIKKHDILFNKKIDGTITEKEKKEMFILIEQLGL